MPVVTTEAKRGPMSPGDSRAEAGPSQKPVVHLDVEQRVALGKAARSAVPRSSHAVWSPVDSRPDPVELLRSQEVARVPELVDLRHERMLASSFAFYRGAAIVMACRSRDHTELWLPRPVLRRRASRELRCGSRRLTARSCSTSTTSTRRIPGPFEWDVKRLAASFEIAARSRELSTKKARGSRSRRRARTGRRWRSSPA